MEFYRLVHPAARAGRSWSECGREGRAHRVSLMPRGRCRLVSSAALLGSVLVWSAVLGAGYWIYWRVIPAVDADRWSSPCWPLPSCDRWNGLGVSGGMRHHDRP